MDAYEQNLWNHLNQDHGLTCTESELHDIVLLAEKRTKDASKEQARDFEVAFRAVRKERDEAVHNSFTSIITSYLAWVAVTFPGETSESQWKHFEEELEELHKDETDPAEHVDCIMLLFALASWHGDPAAEFLAKFAVNRQRTWVLTARGWRHSDDGTPDDTLIEMPDYCNKVPIEPVKDWLWMHGGDGSGPYYATDTHYTHVHATGRDIPAWATHVVYFGK